MTTLPPHLSESARPSARADAVVLLVDDQPIIGEAVRRMLVADGGVAFHYCREPETAIETAAATAPTVILLDLVMPGIDGLELLRRLRADDRFRDVPIIVLSTKEEPAVKAEAFSLGANDYLVKLPDRVELLARVRHHSRGYTALLERNAAFEELRASREALAADLAAASRYVCSLLPPPGPVGGLRAEWRFLPSADLGGDAFGYHELDAGRVAIYLLDVCGHGVGAALLGVSVLNAVRGGALPGADFRDPASVLTALNRAFPMERHNDMFFTMWYGVYDRATRSLDWSGGGHPPALLVPPAATAGDAEGAACLDSDGPLVGAIDGLDFVRRTTTVPPGSRLWLFSDGAFEVVQADGTMASFARFRDSLVTLGVADPVRSLDTLLEQVRQLAGGRPLVDDVSILAVDFPAG